MFVYAIQGRFWLSEEACALYKELAGDAFTITEKGFLFYQSEYRGEVLRYDPHLLETVRRLGPDRAGKDETRLEIAEEPSHETAWIVKAFPPECIYDSIVEAMYDAEFHGHGMVAMRVLDNNEISYHEYKWAVKNGIPLDTL